MATAAPKLAPFDHVLESEIGSAKPTIFRLRPLTAFEYLRSGEITATRSRTECFEYALQVALIGWSHFIDDRGAEIEFSRKQSENLERLTVEQASDLVNRIFGSSALSEEERKN